MATGKTERSKLITGTITAVSGFTVNEAICRQIGNVVWVKCYIQKSSGTIPSSGVATHIATFSGVDLPDQNLRFVAGCGPSAYQSNNCCYAITGVNGKFEVLPSVAANVVVINLTYIVSSGV